MLSVYKSFLVEETHNGEMYSFRFAFGLLEISRISDLAVIMVFGFPIFKKLGCKSVLFGVNWNA